MDRVQENEFSMYLTVEKTCELNSTVISTLPVLGQQLLKFKSCISKIKDTRIIQETDFTGYTDEKKIRADAVIEKADKVVSAAKSYVLINKVNTLLPQIDFTKTDLLRAGDTGLSSDAQGIYNAVSGLGVDLTDYGLPPAELTAFQTLITSYNDFLELPRAMKTQGVDATQYLVVLFKEGRTLLETMDLLVNAVKDNHPDFFNQYTNARKIIDLGGGGGDNPEPPAP